MAIRASSLMNPPASAGDVEQVDEIGMNMGTSSDRAGAGSIGRGRKGVPSRGLPGTTGHVIGRLDSTRLD
jgi:hypothetical protein